MRELIIFLLGGFTFRYGVDWFDMITQRLTNKQTLSASKIQKEIDELSDGVEQTPQIGFQYEPLEEYYDEEFEDKRGK